MDRDFQITIGDDLKLYQCFNGRKYTLHPGERYFRRHKYAMHWHVWEFYHGKRPKGFHVHHIDDDPWNNQPDNLSLEKSSHHLSEHGKRRHKDNPEWSKEFYTKGIEAAKEWHSSPDGIAWHKEQGKRTWIDRQYVAKICQLCGNEYKTRHAGCSKYCNQNCKAKANRRRKKQMGTGV